MTRNTLFRRRGLAAAVAVALVAMVSGLAGVASGDIITLKDGRRIGGEVLSENSRLVRIKDDAGNVEAIRTGDIEKIEKGVDLDPAESRAERDAPFMPGLSLRERMKVGAEAERFSGPLGFKLAAAARPHVWVFGDHPQLELSRLADKVEATLVDYADTFGVPVDEVLSASDAEQLYVFQFRQEPQYLRFIDRIYSRMRDETVNDARLKLMKRQKGFWVMTPRPLIGRYMGPSTMQTEVSNASHLTSHLALMLHEPAGAWMPWWFLEGFAVWQEIRVTSYALTYCIEVSRPGEYAKEGTPDADELAKAKLEKAWRKKVKARVRRRDERDLAILGALSLNEIELDDVQQSWSVVDWLHRTDKLVKFTRAYKEHRELDKALNESIELGVTGAHERWRYWVLQHY